MKDLRFDLRFDLKDSGFEESGDLRLEICLNDLNIFLETFEIWVWDLIWDLPITVAVTYVNAITGERPCPEGRIKCNSGLCVDQRLFCDGIISCDDHTTVEEVCRTFLPHATHVHSAVYSLVRCRSVWRKPVFHGSRWTDRAGSRTIGYPPLILH